MVANWYLLYSICFCQEYKDVLNKGMMGIIILNPLVSEDSANLYISIQDWSIDSDLLSWLQVWAVLEFFHFALPNITALTPQTEKSIWVFC